MNASESSLANSYWIPEELAQARSEFVRRHIQRGWTLSEGMLSKGQGKSRVETRVRPGPMASKSGDLDFNPRTDAFALRLGAVFAGPNRYRLTTGSCAGQLVDRNGMFRDPGECPECGCINHEYCVVQLESRNPFAKPWDHAYTNCRTCAWTGANR